MKTERTDKEIHLDFEMIAGNRIPSLEEVKTMAESYPYWAGPAISLLKSRPSTLSEEEEAYLRRRIGSAIGPEDVKLDILGELGMDFSEFYPDERTPELGTTDAIEAFLGIFGPDKKREGNEAESDGKDELDALMGVPTDYASMMEAEALRQEEAAMDEDEEPEGEIEKDVRSNLSESFAQVMIRNENYGKALEILEKIQASPEGEKGPYLEDQIRFLRLLLSHTPHN